MQAVGVLEDPKAAAVALDPLRAELLHQLSVEPASASEVASELGQSRQKIRYHLRALEEQGLVVEVDRRAHGGITERVLAPSAAAFVVSPAALGRAGADPAHVGDRRSAAYLVAVAGRAIREVAALLRGAAAVGKQLPTLTLDTEIRFRSAAERAAFADELAAAVVDLGRRYHDEAAPDGRTYRLVAFAHPRPEEDQT